MWGLVSVSDTHRKMCLAKLKVTLFLFYILFQGFKKGGEGQNTYRLNAKANYQLYQVDLSILGFTGNCWASPKI